MRQWWWGVYSPSMPFLYPPLPCEGGTCTFAIPLQENKHILADHLKGTLQLLLEPKLAIILKGGSYELSTFLFNSPAAVPFIATPVCRSLATEVLNEM